MGFIHWRLARNRAEEMVISVELHIPRPDGHKEGNMRCVFLYRSAWNLLSAEEGLDLIADRRVWLVGSECELGYERIGFNRASWYCIEQSKMISSDNRGTAYRKSSSVVCFVCFPLSKASCLVLQAS